MLYGIPGKCPAHVNVILGDARLSLVNARDDSYDLIILDVFSSDAIPTHLLTKEALKLYLAKLSEDGVMAFHISNRHLDLKPILGNLANEMNLVCLAQDDMELSEAEKKAKKAPSTWAVMARQSSDLGQLAADRRWKVLSSTPDARLWTDDFSNIVSVFKWSVPGMKR